MKTRRSSVKKQKGMTIPELKKAFDQIEQKVDTIHQGTTAEKVKEFQKYWKSIFGREVSTSAAEAYLAVKKSEKKTRKVKKMRGGAAPLDYQMRPGTPLSNSIYPVYVTSGLTDINNPACGVKEFTPVIPQDMGSNHVGGGSIPPTVYQDLKTAYEGGRLPPSPAAETRTWNYR
jgi:hypothetical protein